MTHSPIFITLLPLESTETSVSSHSTLSASHIMVYTPSRIPYIPHL
jgi:hypothetical protein